MPDSVEPVLRRLARRLAVGQFLDVWPRWAAAAFLAAGAAALTCRLFVPAASTRLPWLWLAPLLAALPVLVVGRLRAYRRADVVAIADSLSGGHGLLLAMHETGDRAWATSAGALSRVPLPRIAPARRLAPIAPAAAFFVAALWLPQRVPPPGTAALADDIASDLSATVTELKQQSLVTETEEERLREEIERIRQGANERVDAGAWEAADALREQMAAAVARKQDAAKWAQESLARYADAIESGANAGEAAQAQAEELAKALQALARTGLLAEAPAELQRLSATGKLPTDPRSLRQLQSSLARYLADMNGRNAGAARLAKAFGRFDPSEFPLASEVSPDGDGDPGSGGVNRGRGDADLTWGKETAPFDQFKAKPLPPGAARRPDDWTPVMEVPGVPRESPEVSGGGAARRYDAVAGQTAWRRNLAPRHQRAVKNYFVR